MKKYSWSLFILFCVVFSNAIQAQIVRGSVYESDGVAAEFATVVIMSAEDSSMVKVGYSETNGQFEIPNLETGDYFLEITYVGFQTYQSPHFHLEADETKIFDRISLSTGTTELTEVVVTAQRPLIEVHPDKTVFNVEGSISAQGSNGLELLRKSPGVVVDNNENIMLMGKSGVQVYINGKPSPLSVDDLANYLRTLQSNEIEAIEIITNPSAKYEAEGNAGIINIKLKKDKKLGFNATLNLGYGVGINSTFNNSVNFNYRDKFMNVFGGYTNYTGKRENFMNGTREQIDRFFELGTIMLNDDVSHNFKLGSDFFISKKSTIGVLVSGYVTDNIWSNNTNTRIFDRPDLNELSILAASNEITSDLNNLNFNLNYQLTGENGTSWNFDADYGVFENYSDSDQPNDYLNPVDNTLDSSRVFAAITDTEIEIYTLKGDHERQLWGGTLSAGFKISTVETDNIFDFYDVVDDERIIDLDASNRFVYTETVNALYTMYNKQLKNWNINAGLRMEHTHSKGDLTSNVPTNDDVVERDYVDFFPSGGIAYNLNQKNTFRVNYSRRIDRPNYQDLNPFEFKLDELAFRKGNPFLRPQYTNNYSVSWQHNYTLNVSLSYSETEDYVTRITDTLSGNRSILTFVNLATQKNWSLNVSYPWSPTDWYSIYANLTLFRTENFSDFGDGKIVDVNAEAYNIYSSHTFKLPKEFRFEISGFYSSPSIWGGNFETDNYWTLDVGLQKRIFDGKGNIKVSVTDIFEGQRWRGVNRFGQLAIDMSGGWESRRFRVNFSYIFGNNEVKSARKRKVGLEEETSRISTDQN